MSLVLEHPQADVGRVDAVLVSYNFLFIPTGRWKAVLLIYAEWSGDVTAHLKISYLIELST